MPSAGSHGEIGPVLDLEDVAGGKVCALASRVEPRDYADTAGCSNATAPAALIDFARRLDPGLTARDFADAGLQLDQIDDDAFARYGLSRRDVAALRDKFAGWPRTPQAVTTRPDEAAPADPRAGRARPGWQTKPGR